MIQQKPKDILEVEFEGKFYYLVVITNIVYFGGNIVFAFHGSGKKIVNFEARPGMSGFNICTDLLLPKKTGVVSRLGNVEDVKDYIESDLVKRTHPLLKGEKAKSWWLSPIDNLSAQAVRVEKLTRKQEMAMDSGNYSFDMVAKKIMSNYKPNKNPYINRVGWLRGLFS